MCNFCDDILDINQVEKMMKPSQCYLARLKNDIVFTVCIGKALYCTPIEYCPCCGRELLEEEDV